MIEKLQTFLKKSYVKALILLVSIMISEVNAETKIVAKNGDTLLKLSKQYEVSLKELMYKNNFNDANKNIQGEVIIIPIKDSIDNKKNKITYKVLKGDTLYKIARKYQIHPIDIMSLNQLDNASYLKPDQIIILPSNAIYKNEVKTKKVKLASKKVSYHQKSSEERLSDIAQIHNINIEEIIALNKIVNPSDINPEMVLKIRRSSANKSIEYGPLRLNWSDWRYFKGNYITQVKNRRERIFFLAINCEKRVLNNTLKYSYWTNWYFPKDDFEYKLINDFCDQDFML